MPIELTVRGRKVPIRVRRVAYGRSWRAGLALSPDVCAYGRTRDEAIGRLRTAFTPGFLLAQGLDEEDAVSKEVA